MPFVQGVAQASKVVERYTYPLLVDDRGVPDLVASAIFIKAFGACYLVTAAHAIRQHVGRGFMTRGRRQLAVIPGHATVTKADRIDPYDLAALRISPSFVQEHGIEIVQPEMFAMHWDVSNPNSRGIGGYPVTKNKRAQAVDRATKMYTMKFYAFFGSAKFEESDYLRFNKSSEHYVGLRYDSPGTDDRERELTRLPSPMGMSGGGAWLVPDLGTPERVLLEGVFIECHKNQFAFSTKLEHALGFIHASKPKLPDEGSS
jgi:hypothetical protein